MVLYKFTYLLTFDESTSKLVLTSVRRCCEVYLCEINKFKIVLDILIELFPSNIILHINKSTSW